MYCVFCDKDIQWIEVHLQQNHETGLLQYLKDYFQVIVEKIEVHVECLLCDHKIKWLQDHLLNKHSKTPLMDYVHSFYIKSDVMQEKVVAYQKHAEETRPKKKKVTTRINALKEDDLTVLAFQKGEAQFESILTKWIGKIRVQLSKSGNLVVDLTKQEGLKDLEQELHAVLYQAACNYDSDKAVFNTYAWNCINSHLATVASYNKASKRAFKMVGADDILSGRYKDESIENNDKVSLLHYLNKEDSTSMSSQHSIELLDSLESTCLTPTERLVAQCFLNNLSKRQISELLLIESNSVEKIIRRMKTNQQLRSLLLV